MVQEGSSPYFRILERAHEGSRPPSPRRRDREMSMTPEIGRPEDDRETTPMPDGSSNGEGTAKGYYERYFIEDKKLGMGAEGSVYLATHVIGGNVLGESQRASFALLHLRCPVFVWSPRSRGVCIVRPAGRAGELRNEVLTIRNLCGEENRRWLFEGVLGQDAS